MMTLPLRTLTCLVVMALACFAAGAQVVPTNDDAADASSLDVELPGAFDNRGATAQTDEVSPGAGSSGPGGSCNQQDGWCPFETAVQNSVWFTFDAPDSGCVDIGTDISVDLQLAVWDVSDPLNFETFVESSPPTTTAVRGSRRSSATCRASIPRGPTISSSTASGAGKLPGTSPSRNAWPTR